MNGETARTGNAFIVGAQFLVALSLVILLAWQLMAALEQRSGLLRVQDQQTAVAGQAAQVEGAFKAMMTDLVALSESDADARGIALKYRISLNPAPNGGGPAGAGEGSSK